MRGERDVKFIVESLEFKGSLKVGSRVWHKLESLAENSVIFECKEGPFVPHEIDGVMSHR